MQFWIVKARAVLGPEHTDDQEISSLNRVVRWTKDCLLYEADPRHVEKLLREADMESCKSLITPGVKEVTSSSEAAWFEQQQEEDDEDLDESEKEEGAKGIRDDYVPIPGPTREFSREEFRSYRSAVARCNYLASGRFEIVLATKELCRGMSNPTEEDMQILKSSIRFLKGLSRMIQRPSSVGYPGLRRY